MKSGVFVGAYYVFWRELKRLIRQKTRIVMTITQPLIWLVLMGNMMAGLTDNPYGAAMLGVDNYLVFMTPGIMVMSSLFSGVFSGVSVIWDRRMGFLEKMLSSPIPRFSIPVGKIWGIVVQVVFQMIVIIIISHILGVRFTAGLAGAVVMIFYCSIFASIMGGISLSLSTAIKSPEVLFTVVNFLTMPLIFTSNAMFPAGAMPSWLQVIARYNPVTFAVSPMRTLATEGWVWADLFSGFLALLIMLSAVLLLAYYRFEKKVLI